jgi:glycosyltransferase involved in cell wall biosynthesis
VKVLLFANTDWYLYNFRLSLAEGLRDAGFEVLLVSPDGPYGQKLLDMGFRWLPAPMERSSLNPLRELALVWWLRGLMGSEHVDLVHGFTIKNAVYGLLAARLAGVSARVGAVTGMGYVFTSEDLLARLLRPLIRRLFRLALSGPRSLLILQNPDDMRLFLEAGLVEPDRVRLIPGSGVDCERFAPASAPRKEGPFRIVLPARLLWDKGVAEYAEASRLLKAKGHEIEFLVAGSPDPGNPASVPQATLEAWEAQGLVRCLGHVADMPTLFHSVDAVVLPSYREGLPKGLIEAGACSCPLVTTDVPGCREVVSHDEDGLLVPARDAEALAAAILRLSGDPALSRRLGDAARRKALERFDERIIVERTIEVYRELVP